MRCWIATFTLLFGLLSSAAADEPAATGGLGSKDPGLYNLKGQIYFLPDGTDKMPPGIEKTKVEGVIYTESLDVSPRSFDAGFPGVTNRFEWFGIIYSGTFQIANAGAYQFHTLTDDG